MGTNVYAYIKNYTYADIEDELNILCQNHDLTGIINYINSIQKNIDNSCIHIGKRSGGWKFLFNHNNWKYYGHTKKSIMKFLKSCAAIQNEYGEDITPDEFWSDYVDKFKDGITGKEYTLKEIKLAEEKAAGKIHGYVCTYSSVAAAEAAAREAASKNYYEAKYDENGEVLNYNKLDYRFSDSTEFC